MVNAVSANDDRWVGARAGALDPIAVYESNALVHELQARGRDVIALYGSPHWLPPEHVLEAARHAVTDNVGVPGAGHPDLLAAIAERLARENDVHVDPERDLVVTNAANHGLAVLFATVLDPGDEVVTYAPHYYFQGIIALAGGTPTYAPTSESQKWAWDHEALRAAITSRTKVLLVNTPTNPTGHVASREDLSAIVDLAIDGSADRVRRGVRPHGLRRRTAPQHRGPSPGRRSGP